MVTSAIHRLDHNAEAAFEAVNARFQSVLDAVEAKRQEVLADVRLKRDEKRKVLDEQLHIIQAEKAKVDADVKVSKHTENTLCRCYTCFEVPEFLRIINDTNLLGTRSEPLVISTT